MSLVMLSDVTGDARQAWVMSLLMLFDVSGGVAPDWAMSLVMFRVSLLMWYSGG